LKISSQFKETSNFIVDFVEAGSNYFYHKAFSLEQQHVLYNVSHIHGVTEYYNEERERQRETSCESR
jgi:hypothetical protein